MKRTGMFFAITILLTWGIEYAMIANGGMEGRWASVLVIVVMAMPALGSVITRGLTKEGFSNMYLRPQAEAKDTIKMCLLAWLLPAAAITAGALLYFLLHPSMLDGNMNYYTGVYQKLYEKMGADYSESQIHQALVSQVVMNLLLSPFLNLAPALGCELGFRGYLMPRLMERYKAPAAVLISGFLWGVWYFPLVEMGQYYGTDYNGYPYLGMAAMCLFCIVFGTFLTFLAYKTKSCVTSAIALSVFNSFSSTGAFFCKSDDYSPFVGPVPTGIIGGIGFVFLCLFSMKKLMEMTAQKK